MSADEKKVFLNDYASKANQYAKHSKDEGTIVLAYREFGKLFSKHIKSGGNKALDFGTGTGRSRRYLEEVGFDADGVDINIHMLEKAKKVDESNEEKYLLIDNGKIPKRQSLYDLVFSSLVVLEIGSTKSLYDYFSEANRVLKFDGTLIVFTVNDDFYKHKWTSIDTDYPENHKAKSGDKVRCRIKEIDLELEDYYWSKQDYRKCMEESGFTVLDVVEPVATDGDGCKWGDEVDFSPYAIFVLKKTKSLISVPEVALSNGLNMEIPGRGFFTEKNRTLDVVKFKKDNGSLVDRNNSATIKLVMSGKDMWPFHKLESSEKFKYIDGHDLIIHMISPEGTYERVFLGVENEAAKKEFTVPPGYWYAEEVSGNCYSLIEATTTPAFNPDDCYEASAEDIIKVVGSTEIDATLKETLLKFYPELNNLLGKEKLCLSSDSSVFFRSNASTNSNNSNDRANYGFC